jgi:hypothetical protein
MKITPRSLAALAVVVVASCSIDHRSGDFACTAQSECKQSRVCVDGLCIVPDSGSRIDASPDPGSAVCPSQCTSCDLAAKTCIVDCSVSPDLCRSPITCPAGMTCDIRCTATEGCRSDINCTNAKACQITCAGSQSCRNVVCGPGPCTLECSGLGSCRNFSCGLSCACDVSCAGFGSCGGLACKSAVCSLQTNPRGCTSKPDGCNRCPAQ